VVLTALDLFKPQAAIGDEPDGRQAEFEIEAILREIQLFDETKPFMKQKAYERWLGLMKKDLGPLADRPAVWGVPADRARDEQERFRPLREELIVLSRKALRAPDAMSSEERRRLDELWNEVAKIREGRSD
jgi:hypothetical protein